MRFVILLQLVLICAIDTSVMAGTVTTDSLKGSRAQYIVQRGFFGTIGTVLLQTAVGGLGGYASLAILSNIHPVAGGIGWVAGSSYGVYIVGDWGTGRGNFPWTIGVGAGVVLAWTPLMTQPGSGRDLAAGLAILTSLVGELVTYHATEDVVVRRVTLEIVPQSNCQVGPGHGREIFAHPCLMVRVAL
jgi:hypothetical protein